MLANIRVNRPQISKNWETDKKTKGSSLKSLQNVRYQIQSQQRQRRDFDKASKEGKSARMSLHLDCEIKKALAKLRGEKVHDDLSILRKAEKRLKRKKSKSAENWEKRKGEVKKSQLERQEKRKENIQKFRGSTKKKAARTERVAAGAQVGGAKVQTRKMRRHENLMKFGPKKDRAEREEKRKAGRKANRKTGRTSKPSSR